MGRFYHEGISYKVIATGKFAADEDLRSQNVLLLTSFYHCYVKCSKIPREKYT